MTPTSDAIRKRPVRTARSAHLRGAAQGRNHSDSRGRGGAHAWVAQIRRLQRGFAVNQMEFAAILLHCAPRSLLLWNKGSAPNASAMIRLQELSRLYAGLSGLMPREQIGPWMRKTNGYLDPLTPLEVLGRGEIDRLWQIIHNVGSGMPT